MKEVILQKKDNKTFLGDGNGVYVDHDSVYMTTYIINIHQNVHSRTSNFGAGTVVSGLRQCLQHWYPILKWLLPF